MNESAIERLINDISKLPGLGRRSAQRIALFLLKNKNKNLLPLIQTLDYSSKKIVECSQCGNIDMINPILKDRLTIIKYDDYSTNDKIIIAKEYLIPNILKNMKACLIILIFFKI